jgi:hypothetical protein
MHEADEEEEEEEEEWKHVPVNNDAPQRGSRLSVGARFTQTGR